ncbi:hypothetical protein HMPREF1544_00694 [Mucor circinelloides 1006PhL]|uniref:Uncharacterized protein n=1 Tax=Mucor circinelloides f. circinelloides (strain 1006PhL) TaxID=1220926 RepID=S2JQ36_MUCC1|nr:hypothetical protein HMPREF1544_00694 [Mucor circinelloides 1006PhL]
MPPLRLCKTCSTLDFRPNPVSGLLIKSTSSRSWLQYIDDHFLNGVTPPGNASSITFQRGVSQSCIDYIMLSNDLASSAAFDHCNTSYIQPACYPVRSPTPWALIQILAFVQNNLQNSQLMPTLQRVWQTIQHHHLPFLSDPWTSYDLHLLLITVRFPIEFPQSALLVIAATLESIWISHWSFIFSDTPFTLDSVLSLVESKILKYQQESFITAGIPHCPPPFFSVD